MAFSTTRSNRSALAVAAVSLAYPFLAVAGVHLVGPGPVVVFLVALLCVRILGRFPSSAFDAITIGLFVIAFAELATMLIDAEVAARLYPVFMNFMLLVVFAITLWRPPSMIERFARVMEPDLDSHGMRYTRKVTIVWCAFFMFNGCVALWTVFERGWDTWAIYNGGVAYVLAGLLFAGEFLVRRWVRAKGHSR